MTVDSILASCNVTHYLLVAEAATNAAWADPFGPDAAWYLAMAHAFIDMSEEI